MSLAAKVLKGDVQAAARLITLLEDENPEALKEMETLYPHTGRAHIIGVTGAPGVGKSTLTDCLIGFFRRRNMSVGVIAIDPTSAKTGGALLGDRIRMQRHAADPAVFIRSIATRGWVGGLAKAAIGTARVMDALGKDIILLETVGSGQVELDIVKAADTTLLVMSPGSGDEIQAMKAGILESADIVAVNKADQPGTEQLKTALTTVMEMKNHLKSDWLPPVLLTEAVNDKGIDELAAALLEHREYLKQSGRLSARCRERIKLELLDIVESHLKNMVRYLDNGAYLEKLVDAVQKQEKTPQTAVNEIIKRVLKQG